MGSFILIKNWIFSHGRSDPDYQIERYAWMRDNVGYPLLSIGCGEGKIEEYIAIGEDGEVDYSKPVYGADINEEYLNSARNRWKNGVFVKYDICKDDLPFMDNMFDTVVIGDTIEHLHPFYFHKLLSDALRVCRYQVIMTTPNAFCDKPNAAGTIYSSNHCCLYTVELLHKLLDPPENDRNWFERVLVAKHKFEYRYAINKTPQEYFLLVKVLKKV